MADTPDPNVKEIAGGWITERKGTDVPPFLKLAYPVIAFGCIAYAVIYMNGETTHDTRGVLVQQFNAVTGTANGFMYLVAGLAGLFALGLLAYAYSKPRD